MIDATRSAGMQLAVSVIFLDSQGTLWELGNDNPIRLSHNVVRHAGGVSSPERDDGTPPTESTEQRPLR